jgi:hypothetical protein
MNIFTLTKMGWAKFLQAHLVTLPSTFKGGHHGRAHYDPRGPSGGARVEQKPAAPGDKNAFFSGLPDGRFAY